MSLSAPGLLDQKITIQRYTETEDGAGGFTEAWTEIATDVWARVLTKSGDEDVSAMQVRPVTTYNITLRRGVDVTEADRIVWSGRTLLVKSAPPCGRDLYRSVIAEEDTTQSE